MEHLRKEAEQRAAEHAKAERLRKEEDAKRKEAEAKRQAEAERHKKEQEDKLKKEREEMARQARLKEEAAARKEEENKRLLEKERKEREAAARRAEEAEKQAKAARAAHRGPAWKRWAALLTAVVLASGAGYGAYWYFSKNGNSGAPVSSIATVSVRKFTNGKTNQEVPPSAAVQILFEDNSTQEMPYNKEKSRWEFTAAPDAFAGKKFGFKVDGYKASPLENATAADAEYTVSLDPLENLKLSLENAAGSCVTALKFMPVTGNGAPALWPPAGGNGKMESGALYLDPSFDYKIEAELSVTAYNVEGQAKADTGEPSFSKGDGTAVKIQVPFCNTPNGAAGAVGKQQVTLINAPALKAKGGANLKLVLPSPPPLNVETSSVEEYPMVEVGTGENARNSKSDANFRMRFTRKLNLVGKGEKLLYATEGEAHITAQRLCEVASILWTLGKSGAFVPPAGLPQGDSAGWPEKVYASFRELTDKAEPDVTKSGNPSLQHFWGFYTKQENDHIYRTTIFALRGTALMRGESLERMAAPTDKPPLIPASVRKAMLSLPEGFAIKGVNPDGGYILNYADVSGLLNEAVVLSRNATGADATEYQPELKVIWTPPAGSIAGDMVKYKNEPK
jgi:hypothetical protein